MIFVGMLLHRLAQKGFGRVYVALPAPIEIHRLASLVHCPVQVDPLASHLYLSFIHAPGTAAALAHHGNQIAIAQLEAQIPAHAQHHDLSVKMATFEQLLDRYESWHLAIIADSARFAPEPSGLQSIRERL